MNIPAWSVLSALLLEIIQSPTKVKRAVAKSASIGFLPSDWKAYFLRVEDTRSTEEWFDAFDVAIDRYSKEADAILYGAEMATREHYDTLRHNIG